MRIYIPTRGRAEQQVTLGGLPDELYPTVVLVVDEAEYDQHKSYTKQKIQVLSVPAEYSGISRTRQFILDQHDVSKYGRKLVMVDDDTRFYKRRADFPEKLIPAAPRDVVTMFAQLESLLDKYAHGSLTYRNGANRVTSSIVEVTRPLTVLAYDVEIMRRHNVRFDRVPVMEDFDACLQLLRAGYKNFVLGKYISSPGRSNSSGGCSTYRTQEMQAEGAKRLASLHSPFVRVTTKKTKTAWGWGERQDVIVQWKQAYEASQRAESMLKPETLSEQELKRAIKSAWQKFEKPVQQEMAPLLYWLRIRLKAPGARNDISDKDRGFGAWVDENLGISRRTADRWADAYGEANGLIERETTSSQLTKGLDHSFYKQELERHRTQVQVKYLHCWVSPEKHKQYQHALSSVREYFKAPNDKIAILMGVQYAAKAIAARLRTGNVSKRTPAKRAGLGASPNARRTRVGQATHARRADGHRTVHKGVVQNTQSTNGHRERKGPVTSAANAGRKALRAAAG